ncbi:MAG TPA: hypothetical protein VGC26_06395 [Afipia sp.]
MGIDRHELEHRNWRRSATKSLERDGDIVQRDVPIVPDDVEAIAVKPPRKPRTSVSKVKSNA